MDTKVIVFLCLIVGLGSFIAGWTTNHITQDSSPIETMVQETSFPLLEQIINNLEDGETAEIVIEEDETSIYETHTGKEIEAQDERIYTRGLSWFGLGATEAAAKYQGISSNGIKIGESKGYGILEQLWSRIKSLFWFASFSLLALVIMCFIPATSFFARTILRILGSIIPGIGSIIERLFAKRETGRKEDIIYAIQSGRGVLKKKYPKAADAFDDAISKKLDKATELDIKRVKIKNGH